MKFNRSNYKVVTLILHPTPFYNYPTAIYHPTNKQKIGKYCISPERVDEKQLSSSCTKMTRVLPEVVIWDVKKFQN